MPTSNTLRIPATTRAEYLSALRQATRAPNWNTLEVGVLKSTVIGSDSAGGSYGQNHANGRMLQTHQVGTMAEARRKSIATLRAWVVRNIP